MPQNRPLKSAELIFRQDKPNQTCQQFYYSPKLHFFPISFDYLGWVTGDLAARASSPPTRKKGLEIPFWRKSRMEVIIL